MVHILNYIFYKEFIQYELLLHIIVTCCYSYTTWIFHSFNFQNKFSMRLQIDSVYNYNVEIRSKFKNNVLSKNLSSSRKCSWLLIHDLKAVVMLIR